MLNVVNSCTIWWCNDGSDQQLFCLMVMQAFMTTQLTSTRSRPRHNAACRSLEALCGHGFKINASLHVRGWVSIRPSLCTLFVCWWGAQASWLILPSPVTACTRPPHAAYPDTDYCLSPAEDTCSGFGTVQTTHHLWRIPARPIQAAILLVCQSQHVGDGGFKGC